MSARLKRTFLSPSPPDRARKTSLGDLVFLDSYLPKEPDLARLQVDGAEEIVGKEVLRGKLVAERKDRDRWTLRNLRDSLQV